MTGTQTDAQSDALRAVTDAIRGIWLCQAELELIAPVDLGRLSHETTLKFSDFAQDTLEAARKHSGPPDKSPGYREVLRAIRVDLGEPVELGELFGSHSSGRS